ncbi:short-chain dehydrogenase/reductase SDR [Calocera viscosa TUFC12733]|uniref:Short-chain dehydrogenase/reductase SDR n=1 Tax=Calocera viscosa (strain TUFC12733) TaxID=1330018 RepID=A0A167QIG5_CALVF|nr:short-chain dehydrogenase/reductase SDR [Calocera viscosa TUFC12733]
MSKQFVAIVTGANKGIGLGCIRTLARRAPSSYLNKRVKAKSSVIYLASRDAERGRAALRDVSAAKGVDVQLAVLDVTSGESIEKFAEHVRERHGGIHALINNAGTAEGVGGRTALFDSDTVDWVFKVNYDGVHAMTDAFLPLMHPQGRIVNVSSGMTYTASPELRERLLKVGSVREADAYMEEFKSAVRDGTAGKLGYPAQVYASSKILLNALTKGFAAENKAAHPNLLINYINPGWVRTDMGGAGAPLTPEQGADTACWAAVEDISGRSGVGFSNRAEIEW